MVAIRGEMSSSKAFSPSGEKNILTDFRTSKKPLEPFFVSNRRRSFGGNWGVAVCKRIIPSRENILKRNCYTIKIFLAFFEKYEFHYFKTSTSLKTIIFYLIRFLCRLHKWVVHVIGLWCPCMQWSCYFYKDRKYVRFTDVPWKQSLTTTRISLEITVWNKTPNSTHSVFWHWCRCGL